MIRRKTVAILFAILFFCYYQEWVIVLIVDCTSGIGNYIYGVKESNSAATDRDKPSSQLIPSNPSHLNVLQLPGMVQNGHNANGSSKLNKDKDKNAKVGSSSVSTPSPTKSAAIKPTTAKKKVHRVQQLSIEIQSHLAQLQYFDNQYSGNTKPEVLDSFCNRPRMKCGPPIDCELGCQLHHFVTCLVVAYTTNRTLIPDFTNWPYASMSWSFVFMPILGNSDILLRNNSTLTNCPELENNNNFVNINNEISSVSWTKDKVELLTRDILEYPFMNGVLPVPYEIGMKLKQVGISSPFQWWIGQFVKYIMRLEPRHEQKISTVRTQFLTLQRNNKVPTVGILIRRRDKLGEKKKTSNSLDKYMTVVKKYFSKYESLPTTPVNFTRRVYFSTDDASLLLLAKKQYPFPKWEFLTFQNGRSEVEDLVQDIFLLRECELILCSFSADVCRLVSEILETKTAGGSTHVKSLDHKYFFDVPDFKGKNKLRIILQ